MYYWDYMVFILTGQAGSYSLLFIVIHGDCSERGLKLIMVICGYSWLLIKANDNKKKRLKGYLHQFMSRLGKNHYFCN